MYQKSPIFVPRLSIGRVNKKMQAKRLPFLLLELSVIPKKIGYPSQFVAEH